MPHTSSPGTSQRAPPTAPYSYGGHFQTPYIFLLTDDRELILIQDTHHHHLLNLTVPPLGSIMTISNPGRSKVNLVSERLERYADTDYSSYVLDIEDAYELQADSVVTVSDDGFLKVGYKVERLLFICTLLW